MASFNAVGKPFKYDADLHALLKDLQDLDLTNDIYDENPYLTAHGGQCDIFAARSHRHHGMTVAVKRLRLHILQDKQVSKILLRELRVWSSLDHPNLLRLLGFVMHGKYPAFVSQWMAKGSLRTYMMNVADLSQRLVPLSSDIASGLLHLHLHGIVHSDLKSDNILMSDDGRPLLADFGISHVMANTTSTTTAGVGGSVRWMAVELLSPTADAMDAGKHTTSTDVWAYGMVLHELLSGNIPFFELKNDMQVALAIVGGQKPSRPAVITHKPEQSEIGPWLLWMISRQCWDASPLLRPDMRQICSLFSSAKGSEWWSANQIQAMYDTSMSCGDFVDSDDEFPTSTPPFGSVSGLWNIADTDVSGEVHSNGSLLFVETGPGQFLGYGSETDYFPNGRVSHYVYSVREGVVIPSKKGTRVEWVSESQSPYMKWKILATLSADGQMIQGSYKKVVGGCVDGYGTYIRLKK